MNILAVLTRLRTMIIKALPPKYPSRGRGRVSRLRATAALGWQIRLWSVDVNAAVVIVQINLSPVDDRRHELVVNIGQPPTL
jgi:hypothetical protein